MRIELLKKSIHVLVRPTQRYIVFVEPMDAMKFGVVENQFR